MALNENPTLEEIVNETERLNNLIVDRGGAKTITPKTANQVLSRGFYKGDITVKGDANLIASNILKGKSIFGVAGNVVAGKRWAKGTGNMNSKGAISVKNLAFRPRTIIGYCDGFGDSSQPFTLSTEELRSSRLVIKGWSGYSTHDSSYCTVTDNGFTVHLQSAMNLPPDSKYYWVAYE